MGLVNRRWIAYESFYASTVLCYPSEIFYSHPSSQQKIKGLDSVRI